MHTQMKTYNSPKHRATNKEQLVLMMFQNMESHFVVCRAYKAANTPHMRDNINLKYTQQHILRG